MVWHVTTARICIVSISGGVISGRSRGARCCTVAALLLHWRSVGLLVRTDSYSELAPGRGFEPRTLRLTAACSTG